MCGENVFCRMTNAEHAKELKEFQEAAKRYTASLDTPEKALNALIKAGILRPDGTAPWNDEEDFTQLI